MVSRRTSKGTSNSACVDCDTHSFFRRLPAEISGMIADEMDMPSAMAWRKTCHENYAHVASSLARSRLKIVGAFLSAASALIAMLGDHNSVLGGDAALSFILRTVDIQVDALDVYVPSSEYELFVDRILKDERFAPDVEGSSEIEFDSDYSYCRQVARCTEIRVANQRKIAIWQSLVCGPCMPIAKSMNTVHMNFVNDVAFGCAYPRLTLARHGLMSNLASESCQFQWEPGSYSRLRRSGFSFAYVPYQLPGYTARPPQWQPVYPGRYPCFSHLYICQAQERRFDDHGAMVGFTDPLSTPVSNIKQRGQAPFGIMVVWRLVSSFICDHDNWHYNECVLPQSVWAMSLVAVESQFYKYNRPTRPAVTHRTKTEAIVPGQRLRSSTF